MQGIAVLRAGNTELVAWEGDQAAEILTLQLPAFFAAQERISNLHERATLQEKRILALEHQLLVHRLALERCAKNASGTETKA